MRRRKVRGDTVLAWHNSGFTLLESLIVLAIASVSLAIATQAFHKQNDRRDVEQTALELAAVMRGAQISALQNQREAIFSFDLQKRQFWSRPGHVHAINPKIDVTMSRARQVDIDLGLGQVRFLPNGQNTGATIQLRKASYTAEITSDWLTGTIAIRMLP